MITLTSSDDAPLRFDLRVNGLAIYLDNFAIIDLARPRDAARRERFVKALLKNNGSLLISVTNCVELTALRGGSATSVRNLLNAFGPHWAPVELDPGKVMRREASGKVEQACLSHGLMNAFFEHRKAEVFGADTVVGLSAATFCQLGALMDWINGRWNDILPTVNELDQTLIDMVQTLRAKYDADPGSIDRCLPPIPWDRRWPATFVWHHLLRKLVHQTKGHPLKKGDGRDLCHAVIGSAYGSIVALDKHWKNRIETLVKPNGVAKVYYAAGIDQMVADLETYAANHATI